MTEWLWPAYPSDLEARDAGRETPARQSEPEEEEVPEAAEPEATAPRRESAGDQAEGPAEPPEGSAEADPAADGAAAEEAEEEEEAAAATGAGDEPPVPDEPPPAPPVDEPSGDPATALAVRPDDITLPIPTVSPVPPPVPTLRAPAPPPPARPHWLPPQPPPTWGAPAGWGPPGPPLSAAKRRRRGWIIALAMLLTASLLAVGLVALVPTLPERDSSTAARGSAGGTLSSPAQRGAANGQTDPAVAVQRILASRASAVLRHDRAAFLATVDRRRTSFYRAQAALFDRMITVPFSYLVYKVSAPGRDLASGRVRSRYAPSPVYLPQVEASYRFRGQDSAPVTSRYFYTFVQTAAGWRIAGQGDLAAQRKDDAEIWDTSPVRALSSSRTLVVYHPGERALAERLLSAGERGYSQVDATWSGPWDHKVVILVPHDQREAERLVHGRDLSDVAAVASSQVEAGPRRRVLGNRVIVNSSVIKRYNTLNLQIVVTHEMTHVATRRIGVGVPLFLVEGFADYTALRPIDAPLRITRPALRAAVRAGTFKGVLPSEDDLRGSGATLAYDEGSSFCLWIARTLGEAKVQALYRSFAGLEEPTTEALDRRLRQVLGISRATAQSRWAAFVRQAL